MAQEKLVVISTSSLAEGQRDSGETIVVAFKAQFPPLIGWIQKLSFNSDRKNPLAQSVLIENRSTTDFGFEPK